MDDMMERTGPNKRGGSAASILDALAADECRALAGRETPVSVRGAGRRIDLRRSKSTDRSEQSSVTSSEAFVERATVFLKGRVDAARIVDEIVQRLNLDLNARGHDGMEASLGMSAVAPTAAGEDGEFDPLDDQFGTTPATGARELPNVSASEEIVPVRKPPNTARGRNGRSAKSNPPPSDPQQGN